MRFALCSLLTACAFEHGRASDGSTQDATRSDAAIDGTSVTADAMPDGAPPHASAFTLRPNADTWIRQQFPTEAHGSDTDIRSGSGSATARANRALIQFDVSNIPGSCAISQAKLYLYLFQEDFTNASPTFEVHRMTVAWSESSATWNNRNGSSAWATPGGDFDAAVAGSATIAAMSFGWHAWDITALTIAWRDGTASNLGMIVLEPDDNAGNRGRKQFYSNQSSTTPDDRRPYLHVTCLP